MQISHETIYLSIYVYPRGELKRELKAYLRSGRATTTPRLGARRTRGRVIITWSRSTSVPRRSTAGWYPATMKAT